ncbi:MAG: DUF4326 domain-containing protein [Vicinamibacterales bacterium]
MAKPQRIQRKRSKGWKMPENTVYVGRPTKWGNPWSVEGYWSAGYIGDVKVAAAATVEQFRAWMTQTRSSWSGDTPTAPWALNPGRQSFLVWRGDISAIRYAFQRLNAAQKEQ